MSLSLRATKVPEVVAHGFTRLDIKHLSSSLTHGNDTFEINFTDNRGQQFQITLYADTPNTDIVVDDATAYRINRPDVDLLDAKKFLATRDAYAAESAANEIESAVRDPF